MEPLDLSNLPEHPLLLLDSAPIIYFLEGHPKLGPRFQPLFEEHANGRVWFAVTTITIVEVRDLIEITTPEAQRATRGQRILAI